MRSIATCTAIAAMSLVVSGAALSAGTTHATAGALRGAQPTTLGPTSTGQPNQTCGSATAPNTPGNAAAALGSAFNPNGKAGMVYAGTQPQNLKNPTSVAQYDVACFHQPK